MKMKLLKAWLRIKLKQWSSIGGLAVVAVSIARALGYEIPPDLLPHVDTIGMALAGIVLFFMQESGETDAMKEASNRIVLEDAAYESAAVMPTPDEPKPTVMRSKPSVRPVARNKVAGPGNNDGFNG